MKKIFLDTEFTDFIDCELISIGAVDEVGFEFYAEVTDFRREACSSFVKETVIPLLGQYPKSYVNTKQRVAEVFYEWLQSYRHDGCILCVDYHADWDLTLDLLSLVSNADISFVQGRMIWTDLDHQKIEQYWTDSQLPRHMALYDARANRIGYDEENGYREDNEKSL